MKKHQTTLSNEIEQKIIRLFAIGMSYADISREIEDLYAFSVSAATISAVTDEVCSGQLKLAMVLEFFRYWFSDSFGGNPPLYSCGLTSL
ncbi:hypothetical protein MOMOMM089B2_18925 [Morganella morganii]